MGRALLIVLDSVGIGGAPDAAAYGDAGADTVGHIADACAAGRCDNAAREGPLALPNLVALGLGDACRAATGRAPPGLDRQRAAIGRFGCAAEVSCGKDTPSGHWEIAGVPVEEAWGYFPRSVPAFPQSLIDALCIQGDLPGTLGNCHASGTEIIAQLGEEHIRSGKPICYTSADSVFQIAAHEEHFGLARLHDLCRATRTLVDPLRIGRVIARPFAGDSASTFKRTANRHDYAVPPPAPTLLDIASREGRDVISIGKIDDIFAHSGTGRVIAGPNNAALLEATVNVLPRLADGGLMAVNLGDFDTLFGHRRDVAGYAGALEAFDRGLPALMNALRSGDVLLITADHGCDPTWTGTDHTRERVPILAFGPDLAPGAIGARETFADMGAALARHLDLPPLKAGIACC